MRLWAQRVAISKIFRSAPFHNQAQIESPSSTLWFIKVVCTICIRNSRALSVFTSDYFRKNLNAFIAFGVVLHIGKNLGDPVLAFRFFQQTRLSLNVLHSIPTFDLLLRSLCHMGFHDSAKLVYEYMKDDGFWPNGVLFEFLVFSFSNAGRFEIARELLIEQAEFCNERRELVSSFVYNNFLSLLCDRNRVDEAVGFLKGYVLRLRSLCPDTRSFNIVIRGLCRLGNVDKAFEIFDIMGIFGCIPDLFTYNTLINGLCRAGNVDRALGLLREVRSQGGISPDVVTYTSVISGYCKSGKMEEATTLLDEMLNFGIRPNLFTFNVIIDGFGKRRDAASASEAYKRMIGTGIHPDVVSFTSLIDCHCRVEELDQCLMLWNEMDERKVAPNVFTYSVLINALCKNNRINEAHDLLRQLNLREDIVPPPFVYNPVIDGFSKAGNVDEANAIVAEMEKKGCKHDKMTFTILIIGHCMKGRMLEAISIYNKMLEVGCSPDNITITSLTSCLRKAGMANEANKIELNATKAVHSSLSPVEGTALVRNNMDIRMAV